MTEPTEQEVEQKIADMIECLRDWPDMCEMYSERAAAMLESLSSRLAAALRERDLAIAHDRQPYPTAEAYERVCKLLAAERKEAERQYRLGAEAMLECREIMERTLEDAPGLPLSHCTPAELETWTDAITTVLMNLGLARVAIAESTK